MAKCWEERGCDEEMRSRCPHAIQFMDRCPTKCAFADCQRESFVVCTDVSLLLDPSVDRDAAIKENCLHCEFFLEHGPRVSDAAATKG